MSWLSLHFVHAHLMLLLKAIDLQINVVRELHGNSLWTRTLEGTNDVSADMVLKVFQNISSLCDVFKWDFGSQTKLSIYIDHSIDSSSSSETQYISSRRYFFLFLIIFYYY